MRIRQTLIHMVLVLGGIVMLFPFLWMLSLSFKEEYEIYDPSLNLLPTTWDFANYIEAFTYGEVGISGNPKQMTTENSHAWKQSLQVMNDDIFQGYTYPMN